MSHVEIQSRDVRTRKHVLSSKKYFKHQKQPKTSGKVELTPHLGLCKSAAAKKRELHATFWPLETCAIIPVEPSA